MVQKHPQQDRNFDGLSKRFYRNIHNTIKGRLRLAVLQRDIDEFLPSAPMNILDVGAGQGQWALTMLRRGHRVNLMDVSEEMLGMSKELIGGSELDQRTLASTAWHLCSLQDAAAHLQQQFDLVACHAVLEWLEQPELALHYLKPLVRPGGWVSIIFYNINGLIYKNLLRGNYQKVQRKDFRGARGSLTPLNPIDPTLALQWAADCGFELVCHSGIRVFHDYILDPEVRKLNESQAEALELAYSRTLPYRDLGRYIHLLCQVPMAE